MKYIIKIFNNEKLIAITICFMVHNKSITKEVRNV